MRIFRTGTSTWKWERTTADLPNALSIQCLTSTCRDDTPRRNKKWHNLAINSQNVQGNLKEKTFFYGPSHFNLRICCSLEWLALSTLSGSKWLRFLLEGCVHGTYKGGRRKRVLEVWAEIMGSYFMEPQSPKINFKVVFALDKQRWESRRGAHPEGQRHLNCQTLYSSFEFTISATRSVLR